MRSRGRRYKMGGREIRGLKVRVGRECCISRRGSDCTVEVYKLEKSEEQITELSPEKAVTQQGAAPGVRASKGSDIREGE